MTNQRNTKPYTGDGGARQMQEAADKRLQRGYDGIVPDPTPNANYTVAGNDLPTPETDRELKAAAAARSTEIEEAFSDVRRPEISDPEERSAPAAADDKSDD